MLMYCSGKLTQVSVQPGSFPNQSVCDDHCVHILYNFMFFVCFFSPQKQTTVTYIQYIGKTVMLSFADDIPCSFDGMPGLFARVQ